MKSNINDPVKEQALLEANQWLRMLGRLDDEVVARLVLNFLKENPPLIERHLGAYMTASETVKRSQIRYARSYDFGKALAQVARGIGFLAKATFRLLRITFTEVVAVARQRWSAAGKAGSVESTDCA
jgi:hypothetical protein